MLKKLPLIFFFMHMWMHNSHAQYYTPQNKVWVFGLNAAIDFNSGSPVPIAATTGPPGYSYLEGCASVCNSAGSLLFYTDGLYIYNRLGGLMMPSITLFPTGFYTLSTTQAAAIVPVIGDTNKYYLFSLEGSATTTGNCRLYYTVINMTLAGGLGASTTLLATSLARDLSEKMTVVAGNSCDIWLVVHKRDSAIFHSYNISASGISGPVVSAVGTSNIVNGYTVGVIKVSPNRQKLAMVSAASSIGTQLFDFNPTTGIVSNCQVIATPTAGGYGAEFSPDNTKLYTVDYSGKLDQFDVSLGSTSAIIASRINITNLGTWFDIKLAPDNKIYIPTSINFMDRINAPNVAGTGCGYASHVVTFASGTNTYRGLPNVVVMPIPDTFSVRYDTAVCIPAGSTFSITARDTSVYASYLWNDGITTTRNKIVSTPGIYWVKVNDGCRYITDTIHVTINPPMGNITGVLHVCPGATTTLHDTTVGGTWSASNTVYATIGSTTGIVTGIVPGRDTIVYTSLLGCKVTAVVTVACLPASITGTRNVCAGLTTLLGNGVTGGTWISGNALIATVGSATGLVSGISAGTVNITYANNCGQTVAVVTVTPSPAISGPSHICTGGTATYSSTTTGAVWSSSNVSIVSIGSATGMATGVTLGTANITYAIPSGCYSIKAVTIDMPPDAGTITHDPYLAFCLGDKIRVYDTAAGGTWYVTNSKALLNGDTLTAVTPGYDTVLYILNNACGSDTALFAFYIDLPVPPIIGKSNVCIGDTIILRDSVVGGMWGGGSGIAYVGSNIWDSGIVVGLSAGVAIVTYQMDLGCMTSIAITVNPLPGAGTITGQGVICIGAKIQLHESVTVGIWSSSDTGVATIGASGTVTAVDTGTTQITYTVPPNIYGCIAKATFTLLVILPDFSVTGTITDVKCYGSADGSIELGKHGANGIYHYVWSNGDTAVTIFNLSTGMYTVSVKDTATQCVVTDSFAVGQPDSLMINSKVTDDTCQLKKGSVQVDITGGSPPYSYMWSNSVTGNTISGVIAGSYVVTISDKNGCEKKLTAVVADSCSGITIHDGLSPNGDGNNETWIIEGIQNYPQNEVRVFNKWGDLVFEAHNYDNDWDGTGKNGPLPDGTYYYLVKLNTQIVTGGKNVYTGSLLIKR